MTRRRPRKVRDAPVVPLRLWQNLAGAPERARASFWAHRARQVDSALTHCNLMPICASERIYAY
jgi:hypothetical protein